MTWPAVWRAISASAVAGLLLGAIDAALAVRAGSPIPVPLPFQAAPLPLGLLWATPIGLAVGLAVGAVAARHRPDVERLASLAVAAVWLASLLPGRNRLGLSLQPATVAGAAIAALAVAVLAREIALAARGLPATVRCAAAVALLGASAVYLTMFGPALLAPGRLDRERIEACESLAPAAPGAPSIVLVTIDTLRADDASAMAAYGRLRSAGVEFRRHFTESPWTLPSVASLLTGRWAFDHRAGGSLSSISIAARRPLAPGSSTLATRLRDAGYRTHAVVTNPFLSSRYGVDQGFCTFENLTPLVGLRGPLSQSTLHRLARWLWPASLDAVQGADHARAVREHADGWLDAAGEAPFFLWLHFLDPHSPYGDGPGDSSSVLYELAAFQPGGGFEIPFRSMAALRGGELRPTAEERARLRAAYRSDVAFVDRELLEILDRLDRRGLLSRTAVVLTADHGEEFFEHGGSGHGHGVFDELLQIPLVIRPPGDGGPRPPVEVSTSVVDVTATVLALAGVRDRALPGVDLLAGLPAADRATPIGHTLFGIGWEGVRRGSVKYVRSDAGEERLYDLASDPGELVNRIAAAPERTAEARSLLQSVSAAASAGSATAGDAPRAASDGDAALRALGYVQ